MSTSTLRREHAFKNIEVKIEQFTIAYFHILDFEFTYSIDSLLPHGYMTIADAISMSTQSFNDGTKTLSLNATDANGKNWSTKFNILKAEEIRVDNKDGVLKLYIEEKTTTLLKKYFTGNGYKFTTLNNLATEHLTKIKDSKSLDISANTPLTNFTIPINKPFIQVLDYFRKKYGYFIYLNKKKYIIKKHNDILSSGTKTYDNGEGYGLRTGNPFYYNAIKDISMKAIDKSKIDALLPKTKTYKIDLRKKEIDYFEYDFDKAYGEIGTPAGGALDSKMKADGGVKELVRDNFTEDTIKGFYFNTLKDFNSVEIVVPSNIDLNVGEIVKMEIDPQGGHWNKKLPQKFWKGNFLVHTLTEKIINNHPLQRLVLIKAKS